MQKSVRKALDRHRRIVGATIAIAVTCLSIGCAEILLRSVLGLGHPVLYDSSAVYGFRPLPNQQQRRRYGVQLAFNNLGLRAEHDFDNDPKGKVLFLGDSVTYGGSYIDNRQLFSYLAVQGLSHYESGNAGVNGWGVENIFGLVVERPFLPAEIYVITLMEQDFYRGLVRCQGTPFSNVSPRSALVELWWAFCYSQNEKRHRGWTAFASAQETSYVVEKAARRLKEMQAFLRERGFEYLLFITPTRDQVLGNRPKDPLVQQMLERYGLAPVYIVDRLTDYGLSETAKHGLFHDNAHLEKAGHALWARVIRKELERLLCQPGRTSGSVEIVSP